MATILVTRPEKEAERLARRLRADGHEVIASPVLVIEAIDAPAPDGQVDAIVVSSANAAEWLARADVCAALAEKPVFAVGDRSAESVGAAGYGNVRSASGDATDLATLVASGIAPPANLLAPVGRVHGEEPVAALRARGFEVATIVVYGATPADKLPAEAVAGLRYDVVDAVLHYSPRSAGIFIDLARKAGAGDHLARPRHVCLSPEVAAALPEELQGAAAVAAGPNEDDLLAALAIALSGTIGAEDVAGGPARPRRTPRSRPTRTIEGEARRVSETDSADSTGASTGDDNAGAAPIAMRIAAPENSSSADVDDLRAPTSTTAPTHADTDKDISPAAQPRSDLTMAPENASRSPASALPPVTPAASETPQKSPSESTAAQQRPRPDMPAPAQRKTPIVIPFLAGAIAGALAGAAIMFWAPAFLQRRAPQPAPIDAAALEARLAAYSRREDIAALQQGIAAAGANLERDRNALRAEIEALSQRIAAITVTPAAPAQPVAPAPASPAPPTSTDDAEARRLIGEANQSLQTITQRVAALEAKAAALEQALASRPPPAPPTVDTSAVVRRHALATALTLALARGAPYAAELEALKALGAAPANISALESFAATGAPTPRAFATEFAALIPNLLQSDAAAPASLTDRATGWLRGLVRVRPVGDVAGADPAAIVARIEAALARGALADAHAAFLTLPESRRAVAADFGQRLKRRADAGAAAQALLDESTRALAAPAK